MKPIIYFNDHEYPAPNMGLGFVIKSNLETQTNANHVLVAHRVGNDTHAISNCIWQILDAQTWAKILQEFSENSFVKVRFPNMILNEWQTKYMYLQEQSAEVLEVNANGLPLTYRNCAISLMDTGR